MPEPFRHYEGVPVLDLPADPPAPGPGASNADGAAFLSQLLFYSAAISAAKRVPSTGSKYALRVNPSSGNLHPTEFHFITKGLNDWPDGLYHYRASSHMAEQRAAGDFGMSAPVAFVLSSIAWREAWKYQSRAYRYCLHDAGHAWQSLALAAGAMGCETFASGEFADDEVAAHYRLSADEWPMLFLELRGEAIPATPAIPAPVRDAAETVWYGGDPNPLSREHVSYTLIDGIHAATKVQCVGGMEAAGDGGGELRLPPPTRSVKPFGEVVRNRRSALDFQGGETMMSLPQLSAILGAAAKPYLADFAATRLVSLYVYAHRVEDLERGVYRHWPGTGELERIKTGDQRVMAAGLSLGQSLAGNACVSFSMIADLERATRGYGGRGYRYAHFEAGAIGQRMYVAAESVGLRATGIGAFYDDEVHRYLGLRPEQGQVVYHFAIGHAIPDPRLEA